VSNQSYSAGEPQGQQRQEEPPTLSQLRSDIGNGQFHLVLALLATTDPRMKWMATNCRDLSPSTFLRISSDEG
jgi:hypothetical protein